MVREWAEEDIAGLQESAIHVIGDVADLRVTSADASAIATSPRDVALAGAFALLADDREEPTVSEAFTQLRRALTRRRHNRR